MGRGDNRSSMKMRRIKARLKKKVRTKSKNAFTTKPKAKNTAATKK